MDTNTTPATSTAQVGADPDSQVWRLVAVTPPHGNDGKWRDFIASTARGSGKWSKLEWRDIHTDKASLYGVSK